MPSMTVGQWWDHWRTLDWGREPQTARHTRQMARAFMLQFELTPLDELDRTELRAWCEANPGAARYARTYLGDAVRDGVLADNPLSGIRLAKSRGRADIDPPTTEEVHLLASLAGQPFSAMILLAAYSGVRLSELAHLEARDVREGVMDVRHGKGFRRRQAFIPRPAREQLAAVLPQSGLVFPRWTGPRKGERVDRKFIQGQFSRLCLAADVKFTWHQLRHHATTWLCSTSAHERDIALSLWGHRDPRVMAKIYDHADHASALKRLEEAC